LHRACLIINTIYFLSISFFCGNFLKMKSIFCLFFVLLFVIYSSIGDAALLSFPSSPVSESLHIADNVKIPVKRLPEHLLGRQTDSQQQPISAKSAALPSQPLEDDQKLQRPKKLPKHLLQTENVDTEASQPQTLGRSLKQTDKTQREANGETKAAEQKPWKPWKPHGFGQLSAEDCPADEALFLTPYIKNGQSAVAQQLARVG
jgi:hypothetical protein